MNAEELLKVTRMTMEGGHYCIFTTVTDDGVAHARLLEPFDPEEDLTVWFGTSPTSRKIEQIENNPQVTLAYYFIKDGAYAVLQGTAETINDHELRKHYFREEWHAYFKGGPEGDFTLIKFTPQRIELISFEHKVTPEPYGLQPAILVREGDAWRVEVV